LITTLVYTGQDTQKLGILACVNEEGAEQK